MRNIELELELNNEARKVFLSFLAEKYLDKLNGED